jgi:hypothetical protein
LRSGIPAQYWREHLSDALTAFELLHEEDTKVNGPKRGGPVMSG